jgi:hypothetical protein
MSYQTQEHSNMNKKLFKHTPQYKQACVKHYNRINKSELSCFDSLPIESQYDYIQRGKFSEIYHEDVLRLRAAKKSFQQISNMLHISVSHSMRIAQNR